MRNQGKMKLTKSQRKQTPRYLAMTILVDVAQQNAYVNLQLAHILDTKKLSTEDANLLTELVYGVTQRQLTLDYLLAPFIKKEMPLWLRTTLRLAVFQLMYLDRVPDYAIVNEASEITRMKSGQSTVNFVNAVLRKVIQKGRQMLTELEQKELSVEKIQWLYSMPLWLVNYLAKQYTLDVVEQMAKSLLDKPDVSLRTFDRDALYDILVKEGYMVEKSVVSPIGLRLKKGNIVKSQWFEQGECTIQDDSSMLVGLAAQVKPSDVVLDACAAPGGKTTHLAHGLDAKQGGCVHACDLYAHKIDLIKENADRLQVFDRVKTYQLDAREVYQQFGENYFDVACVDAPCSGLGLMRRKPDIKYTKTQQDLGQLQRIQLSILEEVAKTLKSSGRLVYSTCTIATEENDEVVTKFLQSHPEFQVEVPKHLNLPDYCYTAQGGIQLLPHYFKTDGFYICVLKKR